MLTKQHRFASQLRNPHHRHSYRLHMCGVCHALGDSYGLVARWLTSHEIILLNILTRAQMPNPSTVVMRRCPLNPLRHVPTNADVASQFAANVAVSLAHISVTDDLQDAGAHYGTQFAQWLLSKPYRAALQSLSTAGFDTETLTTLSQYQAAIEVDATGGDPTQPTATTSAHLFAMTARLADHTDNEEPLAIIGAAYGAYLYLMDAFRDYPKDIINGDYNPLQPYTEANGPTFSLSAEGMTWLYERFSALRQSIQRELPRLHFYHSADVVTDLLCRPLDHILEQLKPAPLHFRRWQMADILKAALFIVPTTIAGAGLAGVYNSSGISPDEDLLGAKDFLAPKKKRRHSGDWWCYEGGGSCDCIDCSICAEGTCECMDTNDDCDKLGGCDGCDSCGDSDCAISDCSCN